MRSKKESFLLWLILLGQGTKTWQFKVQTESINIVLIPYHSAKAYCAYTAKSLDMQIHANINQSHCK